MPCRTWKFDVTLFGNALEYFASSTTLRDYAWLPSQEVNHRNCDKFSWPISDTPVTDRGADECNTEVIGNCSKTRPRHLFLQLKLKINFVPSRIAKPRWAKVRTASLGSFSAPPLATSLPSGFTLLNAESLQAFKSNPCKLQNHETSSWKRISLAENKRLLSKDMRCSVYN